MIYFIQCGVGGPIKIGHSDNPRNRLRGLQSANPFKLVLRGVIGGDRTDEQIMHNRLRPKRVRGEWFLLSEQELQSLLAGRLPRKAVNTASNAGRRHRRHSIRSLVLGEILYDED